MLNFDLPTLTDAAQQQGFEKRSDDNVARRLKNREALLKIGEEASKAGVSLSVDDWAKQSQGVLGVSDWLRSTSPSSDTLDVMLRTQNANAAKVAEDQRRSQFLADTAERKTVEERASELALAGKSELEIAEELQGTYGQEQFTKVRANLPRVMNVATHKATQEGLDYGSKMFPEVGNAQEYIKANPYLPQATKDGMLKAAQINQTNTEAKVDALGTSKGGSGGWVGNEVDQVALRNDIRTLIPNATKEREEELLQRALRLANAAAQSKLTARQTTTTDAIQVAAGQNYPQDQARAAAMDIEEQQRMLQAADAKAKGMLSSIAMQGEIAAKYTDPKGPGKGLDTMQKTELFAGLKSHVFQDPEAYASAVISGDRKAIAKMKATATPMSKYVENVRIVSDVTSGAVKFTNVQDGQRYLSRLGASPEALTQMGREIANNNAVVAKGAGSVAASATYINRWGGVSKTPTGNSGSVNQWGGVAAPGQAAQSPMETVEVARVTSQALKDSFIDQTARTIRGMREGMVANGSISATAEQVSDGEWSIALRSAMTLASAMGLPKESVSSVAAELASAILDKAGPAHAIERRVTPAQVYRQELDSRLRGNLQQNGTLPGAAQPSPRLGASNVQAAPPPGRPF